jgi:L-threonylcarbamoyladenylate synthase
LFCGKIAGNQVKMYFCLNMDVVMREDIKKACEIMRSGGIILYPADTVWGIGCDATNEKAIQRVYELKQRKDSKAMLVLIGNPALLDRYVAGVPAIAYELMEAADKPLTIIYEQGRHLPANLTAADGSIGIRVTREVFSHALCEQFRKPVVSTSANISGEKPPANYNEIPDTIKKGVDYIVNYRRNDRQKAVPSSIIKLGAGGVFQIIRQ